MSKIKTWNERCEEHPDHQTGMVSNSMIQARMQEEIDELRAALAEPVEPVAHKHEWFSTGAMKPGQMRCIHCGVWNHEIPPQRPAEPGQEPVAWRWGYRSVTTGEMDWRGYVEIPAHPNLRSPEIIMEPLYAAPPQRKPLSGVAIYGLFVRSGLGAYHQKDFVVQTEYDRCIERFARAIERAHGIGVQP